MKIAATLLITITSFNMLSAQSSFSKQGHRGCRGNMPENTIAAMKKGLDLGAQVLELDVVISKDKKVVVSHDSYMSSEIMLKPSGDSIPVEEEKKLVLYSMTYEEIKKYDAGSKHNAKFEQQQNFPAYKPLLSELIDSVNLYAKKKGMPRPFFNIEIKSQPETDGVNQPEPQEFVNLVMDVLKSRKMLNNMNIQSFDRRPLQLIHQQYKTVKIAYLTANPKSVEQNLTELGFTPYAYSPYYKTVNEDGVKFCHSKNIKIIPWTVNTKEEIDVLVKQGVDGIITDYPAML